MSDAPATNTPEVDAPMSRALRRRHLLGAGCALVASPWLASCASPLPLSLSEAAAPAALGRLRESARAHGLEAYRGLRDINVAYEGEWRALIGRLQPALVDAGFRQRSEERLLPSRGLVGQTHFGPDGRKQVVRRAAAPPALPQGDIRVWFNRRPLSRRRRRPPSRRPSRPAPPISLWPAS